MKKTAVNTLGLQVGDIVQFTNNVNYKVSLTVTRIEKKSWYCGNSRRSYGTLNDFAKFADFKIIKKAK
jgi:hypothetical protein